MKYLWTDLETTGLNEAKCTIIEAAFALSAEDQPLVIEHRFPFSLFIKPGIYWELGALKMHASSGLAARACDGVGNSDAQFQVLSWLHTSCGVKEDETLTLAGSSVHFDKKFIAKYWSALDEQLHYRLFDARTIIALAESAGFQRDASKPAHRAEDDMMHSIREAQEAAAWIAGRAPKTA